MSSSQADGGDIEIEWAGEVRMAKSELTASAAKDGTVRLWSLERPGAPAVATVIITDAWKMAGETKTMKMS